MGPPATIPKILEVEELIVRGHLDGGYMRLVRGAEGRVAAPRVILQRWRFERDALGP